ncbi:OLC1v1013355C1 [Oldenlandia corymbosa var. corymbosa]|uniref:Non-specific lipid-transfer protein n=1 Tax=Oldenlandia corymbosa var. corymbosa TaxID=529605 RepID=A0AAV1DYD2_OLDCO|nr:OLC1v1013355C1 [Oldenlandia corymbosa var. corymbosa]
MAKYSLVNAVVFIIIMIMNFSQAQIPCTTVNNNLLPCASYVMNGGTLPPACCDGFKDLVNMAKTQADRQSVCNCVNTFLANADDGQINNAASIPSLCGVNIHFNITRNMDCSKVNLA